MTHSDEDALFLRSIPNGALEEFRAEMYSGSFIRANAAMFMDTEWVQVDQLKAFLREHKDFERVKHNLGASIKEERVASPDLVVKREPIADAISINATRSFYRVVTENEHEVLELLDSDEEMEDSTDILSATDDPGMSSDTMVADLDVGLDSDPDDDEDPHSFGDQERFSRFTLGFTDNEISNMASDSDDDDFDFNKPSPSNWLEDDISSTVKCGPLKITRQCTVDAIEYLSDLPSYWPIPRDKRAYVVDLSDPKFDIKDKYGKLMTVDSLIKNAEQDSWTGCTGGGPRDSRPKIPSSIFGVDDDREIVCRRSRLKCSGYSACEHINPALIGQERYELDPKGLEEVLEIQIDSRLREADTPEKLALIFFAICHSRPCSAQNERGQTCTGIPKLVKFKNDAVKGGHRHFVSCSLWSARWSEGHQTSFIPSGVKDGHLEILFAGGSLVGFEEAFSCGRIVPAHIGSRVSHCNFPHLGNGTQAALVHHACPAYRIIFVPEDPEIRKACIIPDHEKPHKHPILPPTKTPAAIKEIYRQCIRNAGIVGSSVRTIDNARSTKMTLGTSPSLYAPTLQNNRVKQDIIREEKKKKYPSGTDLLGVINIMNEDLQKPLEERYIHGFTTTTTGGRVIITANHYLLTRIHRAKTLFVDTTFKRTVSILKEWEVVMYDKEVERAVTIARVYSDRADRLQYKTIFDELQRVTFMLTGQHLRLKRLSKEGTLISIGVDMELAQALGAGDSFLPTNEPAFSNIHVQRAEEIIEYFIRACYTHVKRGIHDLKTYVSEPDYDRIINFMYLETKQEVDLFSAWITGLKNPKVQAWWDHKTNNTWILPSVVKCLSKMNPDDWDLTPLTTNVGESQHHWTNINTGTMLSLLEAILTAREVDEKVAAEVKAALNTGVLKNHRNDTFTRLTRNTARKNHAFKKSRESRIQKKAVSTLDQELVSLKNSRKESAARMKVLQAAKSEMSGRAKTSKAESSSSGKVSGKRSSSAVLKATTENNSTDKGVTMAIQNYHTTDLVTFDIMSDSLPTPALAADLEVTASVREPSNFTMAAGHFPSNYPTASVPFLDITAATNIFSQGPSYFNPSASSYTFPSTSSDMVTDSDFDFSANHCEEAMDKFLRTFGTYDENSYQ